MDFIISDESVVNSYGYRVMTGKGEDDGIIINNYDKNLPIFLNHDWIIGKLPIGKTEKLVKKDGRLIATPVFDEEDIDEETQRAINKVKNGFIKGASIGFDVIALSDDPSVMLQGQKRATVTKSELFEWSITPLPSNKNCIKLSQKKRGIFLSANADEDYLNLLLPIIANNPKKMTEIAKRLGLPADADEAQILSAIEALKNQSVNTLLEMGKQKGTVNAKNEAHIRKVATLDYDTALGLVNIEQTQPNDRANKDIDTKKQVLISQAIQDANQEGDNPSVSRQDWTFKDWQDKDPRGLSKMRNDDFDRYVTLAKGYAGK